MLNTVKAIHKVLQGSFLEDNRVYQLQIDESEQVAFALDVNRPQSLDAWYLMRSKLNHTKRYPLLTGGSVQYQHQHSLFSRFFYEEEECDSKLQSLSPEAIISRVEMADIETFLDSRETDNSGYLEDILLYSLSDTQYRCGCCPDELHIRNLIDNGTIYSKVDLEQWLFSWELQNIDYHSATIALDTNYLDWFCPSYDLTLLLLPIDNGWDSLAYLHWYGACSAGTPIAIKFLRKWYSQYKAELVCHYGTILQFNVGKRPSSPGEAFELAWEQEALAPCTTLLPGISLRDHARSLLALDRWFLHKRP